MKRAAPLGAILLALVALAMACGKDVPLNVGGAPPGAGEHDECGNGVDDDGDGALDEDCYCGAGESQSCFSGPLAARGVGVCEDGQMDCNAQGAEFGRWGACTGDVTPGKEQCDGQRDEDCDGAVDEQCEGCTAGQTRPCEAPSTKGACTAGEQRCDDGVWTGCQDATGPTPEQCGNGIDDDCDGQVDDPRLCACTPRPEICGNDQDDDCDGEPSEPACRECTPSAETCNGADDDCDGEIDENISCESGCEQCIWKPERRMQLGDEARTKRLLGAQFVQGSQRIATLTAERLHTEEPDPELVRLYLHDLEGSPVTGDPVTFEVDYVDWVAASSLSFGSGLYLGVWQGRNEAVRAAHVDAQGTVVTRPRTVAEGEVLGAGRVAGDSHVAWQRDGRVRVRRFDDALEPLAPAVDAGEAFMRPPTADVRAASDLLVVAGFGSPGTTLHAAYVRDDRLVARRELALISGQPDRASRTRLATDGHRWTRCWGQGSGSGLLTCRQMVLSGGLPTPKGQTQSALATEANNWDIAYGKCGIHVVDAHEVAGGSGVVHQVRNLVEPATATPDVSSRRYDRPHTVVAFGLPGGRVLRLDPARSSIPRVTDGLSLKALHATVLGCSPGDPHPAPEGGFPDCQTLWEELCDHSCSCDSGSTCWFRRGGGGLTGRSEGTCNDHPQICDPGIDMEACAYALQQLPACQVVQDPDNQDPDHGILLPPDCTLPEF